MKFLSELKNFQKLFLSTFLLICVVCATISISLSQMHSQTETISLFKKQASLTNTSSAWEANGRYSKGETACIENCVRQGGVNCGGVLFFSCCQSQEECITFPLGVSKCKTILPNFHCFRNS